jgi:uncharacterized SAM-binding protein YcdF (DUF218 family)
MRHKHKKGFFFLIISAIFLLISFKPTIIGAVVGISSEFSYSYIISIVFFLASVLIFASRQTLDAIMIPTGDYETDKQRTDRAIQEDKDVKEGHPKKSHQVYLISGRIDKPIKTSQVNEIYKRLRSYGIKPKNIRIEGKSKNTLENVLFSLEKLKKMGVHDVGIASYPTHLDRFEDLIKEAKKEGIIYKNFRVHRLETPENLKQKLYGIIHQAVYRYELAHGGLKNVGESRLQQIKRKLTRIIDKISK